MKCLNRNLTSQHYPTAQCTIGRINSFSRSIVDERPRSGRPVTATGDEQNDEIRGLIDNDPTASTRKMATVVGISRQSVHNVLTKIGAHPYQPIYSQELVDGDEDRRLQFCENMN